MPSSSPQIAPVSKDAEAEIHADVDSGDEVDTLTPPEDVTTESEQLQRAERTSRHVELKGTSAAPGIAIGSAFVYERVLIQADKVQIDPDDVENEVKRFVQATSKADRQLEKIKSITKEKVGQESADIFEAQQLMLHDVEVQDTIKRYIRREKVRADFAVQHVMEKHRQHIAASPNEYIRERAGDLLDVQERIMVHLRRQKLISDVDTNSIIVSNNLTAADIILFSRRGILGCATDFGGQTSHVAIMARALSLPSVMGLHHLTEQVETGDLLIIDGIRGRVIVNPTRDELAAYQKRQERYRRLVQEERKLVPLPAETLDKHPVVLRANLEFVEEIDQALELGAEGVGLFRTEMHFLMQGRLKFSEEEQYQVYRSLAERMHPHPVTIRVLDLGGDKMLPMAHREHNPFLGWRGIRILLDRPELLTSQLRAIIRAAQHGDIKLMLPMVTNLDEIRSVKLLLETCYEDLREESGTDIKPVPLGVMIEVPAAALLADHFAQEVDFFSIGTNDLTQYMMAVDRGNDMVSNLYQPLHPAMLHVMKTIVDAAHRHGIPVSVCGEVASNPRAVPLLVGLGVDEVSASPVYLPRIKRIVRAMNHADGARLVAKALRLSVAESLHELVDAWLKEHQCGFNFLHDDLLS